LDAPAGDESVKFFKDWTTSSEIETAKLGRLATILEAEIAQEAGQMRVQLTQLRRDAYNCRWSRICKFHKGMAMSVSRVVQSALQEAIEAHASNELLFERMAANLEVLLERRLSNTIKTFAGSEAYKGLVLSSPSFLHRLLGVDGPLLTRIGLTQTSYTILRYISRCGAKTSPFSYFGPCAFGVLVPEEDAGAFMQLPICVESRAAVNTQFVVPLLLALLKRDGRAVVEWNSSFQYDAESGQFRWLCQAGNRDLIRRIATPADRDLASLLVSIANDDGGVADFAALSNELQARLLHVGIAVQRPAGDLLWKVIDRIQNLETLDDLPLPKEAMEFGNRQRCALAMFRSGDVLQRRESAYELDRAIDSLRLPNGAVQLHDSVDSTTKTLASPPPPRLGAIYEDVICTGQTVIAEASLPSALQALTSYYQTFAPMGSYDTTKALLKRRIQDWFRSQTDIPLLSFLERLYADAEQKMKKNSLQGISLHETLKGTEEASGNSGDNRADSFRAAIRAICTYDSAAGVMHVIIPPGCSGLKKTVGQLGAFLQDCRGQHGYAWVANHMGLGGGRLVRRWFTHSDEFYGSVRHWFRRLYGDDAIDAAITDGMLFNADVAPSVLTAYIDTPGELFAGQGPMQMIAFRDCVLAFDEEGEVILRNRMNGLRIFTHYDSILVLRSRPLTTQLLALFGRPGTGFNIKAAVQPILDEFRQELSATRAHWRPRVVLNKQIVLRRAEWSIDAKDLPPIGAHMKKADIIKEYALWHRRQNLPRQLFFRRRPDTSTESGKARRRDEHKPQYVSFGDPLWILFFHKYVTHQGRGRYLCEEALPDPLFGGEGERALEHVVHWGFHGA